MTYFFAEPVSQVPDDVAGWWVCEQHRGRRVFWDGGVSVALKVRDIPWANPDASGDVTGFWDECGVPVPTRKSLYKYLPPTPLEGSLRGGEFSVYSAPPLGRLFDNRTMSPRWRIFRERVLAFYDETCMPYLGMLENVDSELLLLNSGLDEYGPVYLRPHTKLPVRHATPALWLLMDKARANKRRELWLRNPRGYYTPGLSRNFCKVKL